jgi:hypothetical protein
MATDTSSHVLAVRSALQYQLSTTKQQQQQQQLADDEKDQEIAALMAELAGLRAKAANTSAASDGSPPGYAEIRGGTGRHAGFVFE